MVDPLETILIDRLAQANEYISILEEKIRRLEGRPCLTTVADMRELQDYRICPYFTASCRDNQCPDCNLIGASRVQT